MKLDTKQNFSIPTSQSERDKIILLAVKVLSESQGGNVTLNQILSYADEINNNLTSRIDNLSKVPSGGTTGDLELQDIRLGADGVTYPNAGESVRTQLLNEKNTRETSINELKDDLVNINNHTFVDDLNLRSSNLYYRTVEGWKLTGDGGRTVEPTSNIFGFKVTSGSILHLTLNKHTEYVYHFAKEWAFNTTNIVGEVVTCSVDTFVVVPEEATYLMVSEKTTETNNKVYTAKAISDIQDTKINDVNYVVNGNPVITYAKGNNRYNKNLPNYLDGYYVNKGNYIQDSRFFVTQLMEVDENTTYYKRENADGIFYDENCTVIGLTSSNPFTTPSGCKYYRTSLSYDEKDYYYVSTVNNVSEFKDIPSFSTDAVEAVKKVINSELEHGTISTQIRSVSSETINTTPISRKAVVTFIDDDGNKNVYSRLYPIFAERNAKFAMAIVSTYIGGSNSCSVEQLKEMHNSGLLETLSHTYSLNVELSTLTEDELNYQFSTSKKWLDDNGLDSYGLVYPQNTTSILIKRVARQYFDFCFSGTKFNDKGYLDHADIQRIAMGSWTSTNPSIDGVDNTDSLTYYKACVDKAVTNGEWLVFMTHIADQTTANDSVIADTIDYIKSLGVDILKPSEAFAIKGNRVSIGTIGENYLFMGENKLETNIFGSRIEGIGTRTSLSSITEFAKGIKTVSTVPASKTGFPTGNGGILETCYYGGITDGYCHQTWLALGSGRRYVRFWNTSSSSWGDWIQQ